MPHIRCYMGHMHVLPCLLPLHLSGHRFVSKLGQSLSPGAVVHHEQPHLPHSWAIIPTPSMAQLQEVVPAFIATEHSAAAATSG